MPGKISVQLESSSLSINKEPWIVNVLQLATALRFNMSMWQKYVASPG